MGTCWYFLKNPKFYLQRLSLLPGERVLFIAVEWLTVRRGGEVVYSKILESGAIVTRVTFKIFSALYSHASLRVLQIA